MSATAELIRVRGLVQGVGFRPTAWRLAHRHGLAGWVANDGEGVALCVSGPHAAIARFVDDLTAEAPPLARIDSIERRRTADPSEPGRFRILESRAGAARTGVVPDAATCAECRAETLDADARRYRYPFTNCTHCGPRLSILEAIPYDRANTTMRGFRLCASCAAEYAEPGDRRFHAQPIACAECGPTAWLESAEGECLGPGTLGAGDAIDAVRILLLRGDIIAVKGLGGIQLACDATNEASVARLRRRKGREAKPFALMARDTDMIRGYCRLSPEDEAALRSPAAPIVILDAVRSPAAAVAPGVTTLGFMLPSTPLHHLLLQGIDRPIVLTSGNLSDEPQCIGNDEARTRLAGIADHFLLHDRPIARRVDDSVLRSMAGGPRLLRRARGYAPAPLPLPPGFVAMPPLLALGGELKAAFCLLRGDEAILSHHMGDLENAATFADYARSIEQYLALFAHAPRRVAVDLHPEYLSTKLGIARAERGLPISTVQHHHAHVAACMAENAVPRDAPPVLGIALDGLGFGPDGTIWGGEFLLADYRAYRRLARLAPVAMPGGTQAIREPWRNTYAHIAAAMGWQHFAATWVGTRLADFLATKPLAALASMIERRVNAPLASSCGRLFDAVAAAIGLCPDRAQYEGQAAIALESAVDTEALRDAAEDRAYCFVLTRPAEGPAQLEAGPMWHALLADLAAGTPTGTIAARFHKGLAVAIAGTIARMRECDGGAARATSVALSGGVFQNRVLLEQVTDRLARQGLDVLAHRVVPANDGGLALGQAIVAAATS